MAEDKMRILHHEECTIPGVDPLQYHHFTQQYRYSTINEYFFYKQILTFIRNDDQEYL